MKQRRSSIIWLALALGLLVAGPAGGLELSGRVVGPDGSGLAGAIISDQVHLALSNAQGGWQLDSRPDRIVSFTAPPGHRVRGAWWAQAQSAQGHIWQAEKAPTPSQLTLAIISDPHLTSPQVQQAGCSPQPFSAGLPWRVWQEAAAQSAALKPDLTLVAGDLCLDADNVDPACAQAQMDLAAQALALLPQPARAIPGNHDVTYPAPTQAHGPAPVDFGLWQKKLGPQRQVYLLGPIALILLDNTGRGRALNSRPRSLGGLSPEALDWLEKVLAILPQETPLVVLTHYPLASPVVGANPLYGGALVEEVETSAGQSQAKPALRDADQSAAAAFKLLAGRQVLALISGHEHAWHQSWLHLRQGSWRLLGLPALCGRWWQGDRPWGPLGFAPGWLSLEIQPQDAQAQFRYAFHEVNLR